MVPVEANRTKVSKFSINVLIHAYIYQLLLDSKNSLVSDIFIFSTSADSSIDFIGQC